MNTASELFPPAADSQSGPQTDSETGPAVGTEAAPAAGAAAPAASPRPRQRNARGQGARLTEDIVTGALALIERSGSDEAVTLRAVAREVGISAPSIYPHFADRDAIVMAVVLRVFGELAGAIEQASTSVRQGPVERLVAGCEAYVGYGLAHPARYGVLFSRSHGMPEDYCAPVPLGPEGHPVLEFGAEAFALLVRGIEDCAEAGSVGEYRRGGRLDRGLGGPARRGYPAHLAARLPVAGAGDLCPAPRALTRPDHRLPGRRLSGAAIRSAPRAWPPGPGAGTLSVR